MTRLIMSSKSCNPTRAPWLRIASGAARSSLSSNSWIEVGCALLMRLHQIQVAAGVFDDEGVRVGGVGGTVERSVVEVPEVYPATGLLRNGRCERDAIPGHHPSVGIERASVG